MHPSLNPSILPAHKLILRVSIALEDVGLDDSAHGAHHLEYDTGLAQPHSMGGAAAAAAQQRDLELFGGSEVDNISSSTSFNTIWNSTNSVNYTKCFRR